MVCLSISHDHTKNCLASYIGFGDINDKCQKPINFAGWVTLIEPGEVNFEERVSKPGISV